jgi:hypothetical protein
MTSGSHIDATPRQPLRLRLKPKAPPIGYVDGGWWPRSRDLAAELPALTTVLAVRLGPITRVTFASPAWRTVPNDSKVDGRLVRLVALRSQDKNIVHVSGSDGQRVTLLVVPPEAADQNGHDAMMLASRRANTDGPAAILAATGIEARTTNSTANSPRSRLRLRLRTRHIGRVL